VKICVLLASPAQWHVIQATSWQVTDHGVLTIQNGMGMVACYPPDAWKYAYLQGTRIEGVA